MVLALCLVGIISGGLLAQVNQWSKPRIAASQNAATEQAIYFVQPRGARYEPVTGLDFVVYRVFDAGDQVTGYAMVYQGKGFQGAIRLMIGLNENLSQITAIEVLDQSETPGLGALITGTGFKDQFRGLLTSPAVAWVKGAPPSQPNEIQAITGATISTKAVVEIINQGVASLRQHLNP